MSLCDCGHLARHHRDNRHRCLDRDRYGIDCECPRFEQAGGPEFVQPDWPAADDDDDE